MKRRTFITTTSLAGGMIAASPFVFSIGKPAGSDFPLIDLHVHLSETLTMERLLEISARTGIQFGVVVNPGYYGVTNNAGLKNFIDSLLQYPVWFGLQPMSPGWSTSFSPDMISKVDYVLMDAQTIPAGNGYDETLRIWNFDTYVDDADKFMEKYMVHILEVINNDEPLNTFGWPLSLPMCIAPEYYRLWTDKRMETIISAMKKKNLNVEINDMSHTPHERFINMSKEQGLKFTFGSDTRDFKAGRLDYCKAIAKKCNLKRDDFLIPKRPIKI